MADTDSSSYPQRLVSEKASSNPQTKSNSSKFFSNFLSKSVLVAILLILLPLFPSQAPEFINQTVLTRSWELLHLLFVGIAVSYGLFSRRNVETEKENQSKLDNTQNYMSRILQVSSVFDDEIESPSSGSDDNKIQTWNSQYFRANPMVLVAETDPVLDEQSSSISSTSTSINKPLLLPVRSLRSQVSNPNSIKSVSESGGSSSGSLSRSGSGVKNVSSSNSFSKTRSDKIGGLDPHDLEEKLKESAVLPSPIPWRSRSGRLEMKEEMGGVVTPPLYSLPPSVGESEFDRLDSRVHRSSIPWSSRPSSTSPSPRKLSPSPSLSPEIRAKNLEDLGKNKNHYKSSPPPPPPPPPPPIYRKSPLMMSNSSPIVDEVLYEKDFKTTREDVPSRRDMGSGSLVLNSSKSEAKPRPTYFEDSPSSGKSVRTIRANERIDEVERTRDVGGDRKEGSTGKRFKEVDSVLIEKAGRKTELIDQQSMDIEKNRRESTHLSPKPTFSKYPKEEKKKIFEKVIMDSDEESDSETNSSQGSSDAEEAATTNKTINDATGSNPNEVDKKAEEFIAKFREQIRLQRIESIKRSSGKISNRNSTR